MSFIEWVENILLIICGLVLAVLAFLVLTTGASYAQEYIHLKLNDNASSTNFRCIYS